MNTAIQEIREDVLAMASERFERRLAEETAALRVEMHNGFSAIRKEMAEQRVELLRWSFLFWLGQIAAMGGMFTLMARALG